jgi:hypothetical protein|tara:strand:+ start:153 stop:377 length:225 start_codon:yes stop_codon:yes gene_type:complete
MTKITDKQIHDFIIDEFLSWNHRHEGTLHNLAEIACQHFNDYKNNVVGVYIIPIRYFDIAFDIMNSFEDSSEEN